MEYHYGRQNIIMFRRYLRIINLLQLEISDAIVERWLRFFERWSSCKGVRWYKVQRRASALGFFLWSAAILFSLFFIANAIDVLLLKSWLVKQLDLWSRTFLQASSEVLLWWINTSRPTARKTNRFKVIDWAGATRALLNLLSLSYALPWIIDL